MAQRFATPTFGSAAAMKMAQACIAYARARNGAVNVWVYNERGEMLHFQRMDGAPLQGPSFSAGPQYGGDPFRNGMVIVIGRGANTMAFCWVNTTDRPAAKSLSARATMKLNLTGVGCGFIWAASRRKKPRLLWNVLLGTPSSTLPES